MSKNKLISLILSLIMIMSMSNYALADNTSGTQQNTQEYDDVQRFVIRLYNSCLDRNPDPIGFADWTSQLKENRNTGIGVAAGFIFSQEYLGKHTSNADYVTMLYYVFLDRGPDAIGFADWTNRLNNGSSREAVFNGFAFSVEYTGICNRYGITRGDSSPLGDSTFTPETSPAVMPTPTAAAATPTPTASATDTATPTSTATAAPTSTAASTVTAPPSSGDGITDFVERLYSIVLERHSDQTGMNDWSGKLRNHQITFEQCASNFFNSQEFLNKNVSNEEYVRILYRTFLNREPDPIGLNDWVSQLNSGKARNDILPGFANSTEFRELIHNMGSLRNPTLTTIGANTWVTAAGVPNASTVQTGIANMARQFAQTGVTYRFGGTIPENGTVDCSAFITNLYRRNLGTMSVIDHAVSGLTETDWRGSNYLYYGLQNCTNRGTWSSTNFTEGRYTASGCGYVYVDKYGITSTDLMDVWQWNNLLTHYNTSGVVMSFTTNSMIAPIQYDSNGNVSDWGGWSFLQDFKPGDLVLWTDKSHRFSQGSDWNHIGVYLGNGLVCHASSTDYRTAAQTYNNLGVQISNISSIRRDAQLEGKGSIYVYHMF